MDLRHKVAIITGGAHRVGQAIALALAREGAHIAVHYGRSEAAARDTVAAIEALGVRAVPVQADLHDPAQIEALFAVVQAEFGRLDILVNSAANFVKQPFDAITLDAWKDVLQVNLRAPFFCTQHAARLMRQVERPPDEPAAIINIADLIGLLPRRDFAQHGISKAGLIHLTLTAALELGPDVRVNAIAPGAILPPPYLDADGERWRSFGDRVPLRRVGHPDDVGQTVVFLARHDYITGAVIPVDGGEHLVGSAG